MYIQIQQTSHREPRRGRAQSRVDSSANHEIAREVLRLETSTSRVRLFLSFERGASERQYDRSTVFFRGSSAVIKETLLDASVGRTWYVHPPHRKAPEALKLPSSSPTAFSPRVAHLPEATFPPLPNALQAGLRVIIFL